jgi:hypothetical protein
MSPTCCHEVLRTKFVFSFEFSKTLQCGAHSMAPDDLNFVSIIFNFSFTSTIRCGDNLLKMLKLPILFHSETLCYSNWRIKIHCGM